MGNKASFQQLDNQFRVLRAIERNPRVSQREIAASLGLSVGAVNYCLKALIAKGWVKSKNFGSSANKKAYAYLLTAEGMKEKAKLTTGFLQRKMAEYNALHAEILEVSKESSEDMQACFGVGSRK